jgi:co-chaperonin GroES (HSP10)
MEIRLLKTMLGQYVQAEWDGVDRSGWVPVGDNVAILPDKPADVSAGGVILGSDQQRERTMFAAETGILISLGDDAFSWNSDRSRRFEGERPQPGSRVVFKRYSGVTFYGDDGEMYWIMSDHCIGAIKPAAAKADVEQASKA